MSKCDICEGYKNVIASLDIEIQTLKNYEEENAFLKNQNEQLISDNTEQQKLSDYWHQKYVNIKELYVSSVTR